MHHTIPASVLDGRFFLWSRSWANIGLVSLQGTTQQLVTGRTWEKLLWVPSYRWGMESYWGHPLAVGPKSCWMILMWLSTNREGPKVAGCNLQAVGYSWGGHPLPYGAQELQGNPRSNREIPGWLSTRAWGLWVAVLVEWGLPRGLENNGLC